VGGLGRFKVLSCCECVLIIIFQETNSGITRAAKETTDFASVVAMINGKSSAITGFTAFANSAFTILFGEQ